MLNYEHMITKGIKGLPNNILAEIAYFVYFMRKRVLQPDMFEDDLQSALLYDELHIMQQHEMAHLEEEFLNYESKYPSE
ncbi:MAG: hypothetical protein B6242_11130 [Anaerolineaceae bacterium 4572_78]|nr:MAG: hypothetical protein B6242_11130 [Anaerolineaceae bacterium 4572_78]